MVFDESIVLRANLGNRVLAGQSVVCRFGPDQIVSLVCISQTLDKLIVHETAIAIDSNVGDKPTLAGDINCKSYQENIKSNLSDQNESSLSSLISLNTTIDQSSSPAAVYFITIKDVINSLAVKKYPRDHYGEQNIDKDLLLIGCSSSIFIYDTFKQINLISISTSASITAIVGYTAEAVAWPANQLEQHQGGKLLAQETGQLLYATSNNHDELTICGGVKKIYVLKTEVSASFLKDQISEKLNAEVTSEKSVSDTIDCLIQGHFNGLDLIVTGSKNKLRIYSLDSFDFNIQACQSTIDELSPINCLCPIKVVESSSPGSLIGTIAAPIADDIAEKTIRQTEKQENQSMLLPSIDTPHQLPSTRVFADNKSKSSAKSSCFVDEQMSYFAFGLDSGFIGVHRLVMLSTNVTNSPQIKQIDSTNDHNNSRKLIQTERLWRHKAKQQPFVLLMYDFNGDGLDELMIGYKNGRLEARAPFTGQLLGVTRCFKSRERLAGMTIINNNQTVLAAPIVGSQDKVEQKSTSNTQSRSSSKESQNGGGILLVFSTAGSLIGFRPLQIHGRRQPLRGFKLDSPTTMLGAGSSSRLIADLQPAEDWTTALVADLAFKAQTTMENSIINNNSGQCPPSHFADNDPLQVPASSICAAETNLNIESRGDDTMAGQCEAKQSADLLHQLSGLQNEQIELKKRACQIFESTMHRVVSMLTSQQLDSELSVATTGNLMATAAARAGVNVSHSWSFDPTTLSLRLFIVATSQANEQVDMIELEDEKRNCLPTGQLIISSSSAVTFTSGGNKADLRVANNGNNLARQTGNFLTVILLRFRRNEETQFKLRIYCSLRNKTTNVNNSHGQHLLANDQASKSSVARIYETFIQMPRYSMFALAPESSDFSQLALDVDSNRLIRMSFRLDDNDSTRVQQQQQVLNYLNENFLCLRFGLPATAAVRCSSSSPNIRVNQYHHHHHRPSTLSWLSQASSSLSTTTTTTTTNNNQPQEHDNLSSMLTTEQMPAKPLPMQPDGGNGFSLHQQQHQQTDGDVEIELRFVDIRQTILNQQQLKYGRKSADQLVVGAAASQAATSNESDKIQSDGSRPESKKTAKRQIAGGGGEQQAKRLDDVTEFSASTRDDADADNDYYHLDKTKTATTIATTIDDRRPVGSMLRLALSNGRLELECENSDLLVNLVRFLVIDRLQLSSTLVADGELQQQGVGNAQDGDCLPVGRNIQVALGPLLRELNAIGRLSDLEASETRIQSELYESADYANSLMQQFAIASQLNEFSIAKELLNELSMILSGAWNAAQAHDLNNKKRHELMRETDQLKQKILFLSGLSTAEQTGTKLLNF